MSFIPQFFICMFLAATPPTDSGIGADECAAARSAARPEYMWEDAQPFGGVAGVDDDTDVLHIDLEIEIFTGNNTLGGSNTLTVRSLRDDLTLMPLRLRDNFTISSVTVDGNAATWARDDTTTFTINLGRAYANDEVFEINVQYNGPPVSRGFGSIEFTTQNGNPLIFTLSEPYYCYTWWPAKEVNADKFTADLAFIAPLPLIVASNGVLAGIDDLENSRRRFRWTVSNPITPYLVSFSATNYNQFGGAFSYNNNSMPVDFYIYPANDSTSNRNRWLACIPMLGTFSDLYGLYPFFDEKYGICQFGFGGGMEHQTITGQGGFGESLTAHELAHQWWGDMITCGTWGDIWLNEGFATYSEALWFEFKPGSTGTPALIAAMADRRPSAFGGSVYRYDTTSVNAIFSSNYAYRKGAWVLHMLRHVLGDEAFFGMLADYRATFEYSTAITADLQAIAEGRYGASLDWFFQQWVYEGGAPDWAISWRSINVGGRRYFELMLNQVQDLAYPTFAMPIDIVLNNATDEPVTVWNSARSQYYLLPAGASTQTLDVDPFNYVLTIDRTNVGFVEGPPRIIDVIPAIGTTAQVGAITSLDIVLHRPVDVPSNAITVSGANTGPASFSSSYNASTQTISLTFLSALAPDHYTVTVNPTIVSQTGGNALDGDIADPSNPGSLPSGDGIAGGAAVFTFHVQSAAIPGDANCDGAVNNFDIDAFVLALTDATAYATQYPTCPASNADANADGAVNNFDIDAFVAMLSGG
ncbi:MAG: hypothetical protein JNG88_10280 [Phycisphaerales bacterium]|nr:hypothetical protein [Phycisphaerales bacterium]